MHAAVVKMIASMDLLRQVYNAQGQGEAELPRDSSTNLAFVRFFFASSELILKFTRVLHTWADIPTSGMCQFSPHHSMMRIMEAITQFGSESASFTTPFRGGEFAGSPYRFHMASTFDIDFLARLKTPMETRPLTWAKLNAGLARYFESWQAQDGGMWEIMNFPAGATLNDFRVQAGRTNVSNVPPVCPDTVDPITTLIYPANGQKVGGRLTVVAECKDDLGDSDWGVGEKGTLCQKVDFKIDGVVVSTVVATPYEYRWDTTLATNANHTVQAVGYDAAGRTGSSATATVTVGN
jgi:YD repeat-containing protein